jgi:hypothetical protein
MGQELDVEGIKDLQYSQGTISTSSLGADIAALIT